VLGAGDDRAPLGQGALHGGDEQRHPKAQLITYKQVVVTKDNFPNASLSFRALAGTQVHWETTR